MIRPTSAPATEATAAKVAQRFSWPEEIAIWPGLPADTVEIAYAVANATAADDVDPDADDLADAGAPGRLLVAAQGVVKFGRLRQVARGVDGRAALTADVLRRVVDDDEGDGFADALGSLRAAFGGEVDEDAARLVLTLGVLLRAAADGSLGARMARGDEPRDADARRVGRLPGELAGALVSLVRELHDERTGSTGHRRAAAAIGISFDTLVRALAGCGMFTDKIEKIRSTLQARRMEVETP